MTKKNEIQSERSQKCVNFQFLIKKLERNASNEQLIDQLCKINSDYITYFKRIKSNDDYIFYERESLMYTVEGLIQSDDYLLLDRCMMTVSMIQQVYRSVNYLNENFQLLLPIINGGSVVFDSSSSKFKVKKLIQKSQLHSIVGNPQKDYFQSPQFLQLLNKKNHQKVQNDQTSQNSNSNNQILNQIIDLTNSDVNDVNSNDSMDQNESKDSDDHNIYIKNSIFSIGKLAIYFWSHGKFIELDDIKYQLPQQLYYILYEMTQLELKDRLNLTQLDSFLKSDQLQKMVQKNFTKNQINFISTDNILNQQNDKSLDTFILSELKLKQQEQQSNEKIINYSQVNQQYNQQQMQNSFIINSSQQLINLSQSIVDLNNQQFENSQQQQQLIIQSQQQQQSIKDSKQQQQSIIDSKQQQQSIIDSKQQQQQSIIENKQQQQQQSIIENKQQQQSIKDSKQQQQLIIDSKQQQQQQQQISQDLQNNYDNKQQKSQYGYSLFKDMNLYNKELEQVKKARLLDIPLKMNVVHSKDLLSQSKLKYYSKDNEQLDAKDILIKQLQEQLQIVTNDYQKIKEAYDIKNDKIIIQQEMISDLNEKLEIKENQIQEQMKQIDQNQKVSLSREIWSLKTGFQNQKLRTKLKRMQDKYVNNYEKVKSYRADISPVTQIRSGILNSQNYQFIVDEKQVSIFETFSLKKINNLDKQVQCMAVAESINSLILGIKHSLVVYNPQTQQEFFFHGNGSTVRALEILNENHFVSGSHDGTLKIWNISQKYCTQVLEATNDGYYQNKDNIYDHLFNESYHNDPPHQLQATLSYRKISQIDIRKSLILNNQKSLKMKQIAKKNPFSIENIQVVKDKQQVVTSGLDSTIRQWDIEKSKCLFVIQNDESNYQQIKYIDNQCLLAQSRPSTNQICFWDLRNGKNVKTLQTDQNISQMEYDSNRLISSGYNQNIQIWNLNSDKVEQLLYQPQSIFSGPIHYDQNIDILLTSCVDGAIDVWTV